MAPSPLLALRHPRVNALPRPVWEGYRRGASLVQRCTDCGAGGSCAVPEGQQARASAAGGIRLVVTDGVPLSHSHVGEWGHIQRAVQAVRHLRSTSAANADAEVAAVAQLGDVVLRSGVARASRVPDDRYGCPRKHGPPR